MDCEGGEKWVIFYFFEGWRGGDPTLTINVFCSQQSINKQLIESSHKSFPPNSL